MDEYTGRSGPVRLGSSKNRGVRIELGPKFIPNNITGKSSSTSNIVLPKVITAGKSKFSIKIPNYDSSIFEKFMKLQYLRSRTSNGKVPFQIHPF